MREYLANPPDPPRLSDAPMEQQVVGERPTEGGHIRCAAYLHLLTRSADQSLDCPSLPISCSNQYCIRYRPIRSGRRCPFCGGEDFRAVALRAFSRAWVAKYRSPVVFRLDTRLVVAGLRCEPGKFDSWCTVAPEMRSWAVRCLSAMVK